MYLECRKQNNYAALPKLVAYTSSLNKIKSTDINMLHPHLKNVPIFHLQRTLLRCRLRL